MKLLVIEDETDLQDVMVASLEKEGFRVETAGDYAAALRKIGAYDYDCILLDIMLPGGNGLDLLQRLKDLGKSESVIIISAKDSLDDKVRGLDLGADDYLAKPFHMAELNARVKSVLRRKSFGGQPFTSVGNLRLQADERSVWVLDQPLPLNRKEFDVLAYFLLNPNRLIRKTSLAEHVWGDHADAADDFEFVYSQIKNLRKKLKACGASVQIQAVYGMGYKLVVA
ncbi:DNA-binding response regulator, OmpR family, contains REC and winged-helix (wHTH) domain [Catalinimonas alkaloidigena]|uniref:DNA-binding response regulator, OmpR family, contains REC and winged-helix (WHTH) domain n=1 Tax=Catalinimonas alkaloidigena TaxID=1075417 RepID=A0A1G8XFN5_9BACT|nr:response regulator transcription factor [Catalinimonas alkaloidigena]SDJ88745.1 DNA-binding response regulator, OmpR family, contains REC and winged-helix (wHTH) domain [Catalinimonas alkaloidigena]